MPTPPENKFDIVKVTEVTFLETPNILSGNKQIKYEAVYRVRY